MYEQLTFEAILSRMLARVPDDVDKREGSIVYDACAPAAAELAQLYIALDLNLELSFADTATGVYLSRRAAEFGVNRLAARPARRRGKFLNSQGGAVEVPLGNRFSGGAVNFTVVGALVPGEYTLEAETPGVIGNQVLGQLLPIDYVANLATAELLEVIAPGAEEESDEALRARLYAEVNEPAFGGNVADYKQKVNALSGVGASKVYPAWEGGGTVKVTLVASDWNAPVPALVAEVQAALDPAEESGLGAGLAPIGHQVTVSGAEAITLEIETELTLSAGLTTGQVQANVELALEAYMLELRREWAEQPHLTVRIAQLDARLLTVAGVEDVTGTTINGAAVNYVLEPNELPQLGDVILHD